MKQIWPTYAYSPTTNVLTLTGLNIDRDQLLLVTAADRGRIMYNFADSSVTASAFTSGANTALTLVATTAGLTTTAALVIYFDDQATSSTVTGTVELGPTSLNALESITVTMGQVTVTGGLTDVQLRASAVTVGGTVTIGNSLTISSLPAISGTVTANPTGTQTIAGTVTANAPSYNLNFTTVTAFTFASSGDSPVFAISGIQAGQVFAFDGRFHGSTNNVYSLQAGINSGGSLSNAVTVSVIDADTFISATTFGLIYSKLLAQQNISADSYQFKKLSGATGTSITATVSLVNIPNYGFERNTPISGTVTASISNSVTIASLPAISGTVTIGNTVTIAGTVTANPTGTQTIAGSVTIGAGTAQIGSVTASISNSVTIGSLPAISGTVTANTFALQGTAVTTSNFTSTTASTVLANYNATREVLTIFNEGAGNLHICAGATCTTIAYQVRLSAGDYYEVPNHQTTITHSAVFATAGTARVTEVS